ncbi:MAG: hypothetical protein HKN20_03000, partial [Gemmatimonadetes bacterium]|nr:hypothetical protein [Gemmatimonadota bacterium]
MMKTTATAWNLALVGLVAAVCMALAAPLVWADGYVRIEADSDGRYNVGVGYSSYDDDYYDDGYGGWYEDELAPYGRWRYIESLGAELWFPYVDDTWRPYTDGHWINTKHGWTWVAYEPWGEIPHHFGRWVYLKRAGWGWVPGDEWGPAWVTWGVADGHIGWAPIPPANWIYNTRVNYEYCGNVSYGYGGDFGYHRSGLDFSLWVFVSNGRFYDSHVRLHLASAGRGAGWFHARSVLPIGPRLHSHYVSRYCATPIRTVVVERYIHNYGSHRIAYYKPHGQTQKIKERGRYGVYTKRQPVYRAQSKRSSDKHRSAKIVPKSNVTNRSNKANTQSARYKATETRS